MLLIGGRMVIDGNLTLGNFTAFYTYLVMLAGPLRMLGVAMGMAQRAVASGNRMFEIIDREPTIQSPADPVELPARRRPGGAARRDPALRGGAELRKRGGARAARRLARGRRAARRWRWSGPRGRARRAWSR